jgi:hypothetical protein
LAWSLATFGAESEAGETPARAAALEVLTYNACFCAGQRLDAPAARHQSTLPVDLKFKGKIWFWRGPAPWFFVTVPAGLSRDLQEIVGFVTYGWGMIPVEVRIGKTAWKTALWPKNGRYIVPIKQHVREAELLEEGDSVTIWMRVRG